MLKIYNGSNIVKQPVVSYTGDSYKGDICCGCFISVNLFLENKVHIASNVTMIGKEKIEIGEKSTIAPGCVLYTSMPDLKYGTNKYCDDHKSISAPIKIGKNVFIGINSVIGCGVKIGDNVRLPPLSHIKPFTIIEKNEY